ncbi:hypothetical protein B296_00020457 [Ensete ventricosum]|uniref:Uncharacterized protein n=1 Tax=Ensete ventricosum TaxID=4639 RepID=A0A427AAZ4_ENSVE|nr:hypothetical protein B296_00020457 [Ensete ventricosum]
MGNRFFEGSPSKGQPSMATASPLAGWPNTCKGVADYGQAPYKGRPATAKPPCKGVAGYSKAPCKGATGCG